MTASPSNKPAAGTPDDTVALPDGCQATCTVCWAPAVAVVRGRNLCGSCGAFMLSGAEDWGPWLD